MFSTENDGFDPEKVCTLLKRAIKKGKQGISLLQHLLKDNMFSLVKAYFEVATCLDRLIVESEVLRDPGMSRLAFDFRKRLTSVLYISV